MHTVSSSRPLPDDSERIAEILLDLRALHFMDAQPFRFTSGMESPIYVDVRRLISTTWHRREVTSSIAKLVEQNVGLENFDIVAGGETAGIPFGAWLADYFYKPMIYVRKAPKGFGLNSRIEGSFKVGQRAILIEDLMSDGGTKIAFIQAMREAGLRVDSVFVAFNYGIFPDTVDVLSANGITAWGSTGCQALAIAAERTNYLPLEALREMRNFISDPLAWRQSLRRDGGTR